MAEYGGPMPADIALIEVPPDASSGAPFMVLVVIDASFVVRIVSHTFAFHFIKHTCLFLIDAMMWVLHRAQSS